MPRVLQHPRLETGFRGKGTALKFLADNHKAPPTGLWFGGETPGQKRIVVLRISQDASGLCPGNMQLPVWTRTLSPEMRRRRLCSLLTLLLAIILSRCRKRLYVC